MKTRLSLLALALSAAVLLPSLTADEKDKLKDAKCPVSGKAAKEDHAVDYRGAKVYLCCGGCPEAFNKDKAKFATKSNHQLVQTGQAKQEKCPISGGDLNKDKTADVSGVKVTFCCEKCQGKVENAKDDKKLELAYAEKAFDKGFKVTKK